MTTYGFNRTALRSTQPKLYLPLCALFLKIALSAADRWTIFFWGAVKEKCYIDKPETINALRDNIRRAIGEIQLHTIDDVLDN